MTHNATATNGDIDTIRLEVLNWLANGRTGTSSKCIAFRMASIETKHISTPSDPSDLKRCMDMLAACPSIKNISAIVDDAPQYAPFIRDWDKMVKLYKDDIKVHKNKAPNLYRLMKRIDKEAHFITGRVLFNCQYMELATFEQFTGVTPTLDNLFDLQELGEQGLKRKRDAATHIKSDKI